MKGLLIKDFKLVKVQKNFFLLIVAIAIGMAMFTDDSSFIIGYMSFIATLFVLSTISYDEFDNGNAFLFCLPISKKSYIIEKYGFGLILGGTSWLIATVIAITSDLMKNSVITENTLITAITIIPVLLIILAVMIPFQIKFGGEKGRIAIIGAIGLMFILGIIAVKVAGVFNVDLVLSFNNLSSLNLQMLVGIATVIAAIGLYFSYKISLSIMRKKEF